MLAGTGADRWATRYETLAAYSPAPRRSTPAFAEFERGNMPKLTKPKPEPGRPAMQATLKPDARAVLARRLEVLAGCELHHGHHDVAERLSWRAAALREAAR